MVLKFQLRLYVLTLAILVAFSALAERLWDLSVKRHEEFKNKVRGVKILRARIPGARGEIKDRNGIALVANKSSFEVQVNLKMLVDDYKRQLLEENRGKPKAERRELPMRKYQYPDRGFMREKDELDIVSIVNDALVEPLNSLGLSKEYNAKQLRVQYRTNRGVVPWNYRSDLSFEEFSRFAEHRLGLSGLSVAERPVRQYLYDALACHVLGYVNQADEKRVSDAERKDWDFYVPDDYGVYGVEKSFDADLRGRPGEVKLIQDEKGHIIGEQERIEPMRGHDVWLTLDARVQYLAERALRESIPAIGRGAVVVLQPATGEVLAMASVPSYNPNKFVPKISYEDFQAYMDNKANPLFNRAIEPYAPGSTYKVAISFAGILAGTEKSVFNCPGGITYGNKYMKCWIADKGGAHGMLNLSDGLKNSCNCFFYQYGNRAGIDNIAKAGHMFGLGEKTGIELDDEPGVLPTKPWLRAHNPKETFTQATVANVSIGQGYVLATPLQMAGVAAAVGNGGVCYRPHLMKYLKDNADLVSEQSPDVRGNFSDYGLTQQKLELVRKGMWKVVNEEGGTARGARIQGVEVAGKTGTAQAWLPDGQKDNHTLFICFAPYLHPQYAVCILVEGGKSGGGCAAPIAKRILEQALNLDKGYEVTMAPVKEVTGNFNHIETVSFEGVAPIALNPNEQDNDTGSGGDEPPKPKAVQEKPRAIPPANIRAQADEEGSRAVKKSQAPPPRRPGFFQRLFSH